MNGSRVMPKIAGMESTAKVTSLISTTSRTKSRGCREKLAGLANEKAGAVILLGYAKMAAGKAKNGVAFVMDLLAMLPDHMQPGVNEKQAEDREDPLEAGDERGAGGDHDAAHDQRAQDAPLEDAVLHFLIDLEGSEDHQENE